MLPIIFSLLTSDPILLYQSTSTPYVTTAQRIERLSLCESSNTKEAYLPMDSDGFPKYGLLQFRLETFREQAILYKILPKTADFKKEIWSPELQKQVATRMIDDGKGYRWGCWNKINK